MITKLYTIRDIKTDKFDSPFDSFNDATAKRFFARILNNVPMMKENPQDFTLHSPGTFDNANSILYPHTTIQFIASGLDCLKTSQEDLPDEPQPTHKISDDAPVLTSTES